MKIVLFHAVALPPRDYGGVERVVLWLGQALRDLGHEVWIAALEGSRLPDGIRLIALPADQRSATALLGRLPPGVDVVHFHAPPEEGFAARAPAPWLTTVHGNGKPGEIFPAHSVFLSEEHARRHGRTCFVYNGVDPSEFRFAETSSRKAPVFLSKTSWKVKNLAGAMEVATASGARLTIAGGRRPWHLRARALWEGHRWLGPVAGSAKAAALAGASCLLFPVRWPEPFGLVMVEAMLSGTPVVGTAIGSVPEVVGTRGGIAVNDRFWEASEPVARSRGVQAWAEALSRVEALDRSLVREEALRRFSHRRMAEDYVQVYKKVIRGEAL